MQAACSYGHLTAALVALVLEEVAPIVHTSTANTVTTHGADIVVALHIASGCGSTDAISAGSDVVNILQFAHLCIDGTFSPVLTNIVSPHYLFVMGSADSKNGTQALRSQLSKLKPLDPAYNT